VLLVGTAHGHSRNVIETVIELKKNFSRHEFDVIAGNVATYDGARALFEAGADAVKVGLGPGSICTTRVVAGVGVPQITAIYEASKAAAECGKPIIADGGIKYSGDIPKAIAAGASSVMLGSLLAQTDEAIGEIIIVKGKRCKHYRGMGSLGAMAEHESARERYKQESAEKLVPEGIEAAVPLKGPVKGVIYQILGGIQSGMGYVGARNIKELQEKGRFHRQTKAGLAEGHPHDVEIIKEAPNYHPKGE
jgi:IMP dehydrogenase